MNCCKICIMGSPPRMRGKGAAVKSTVLDLRITPAYAGKSGRIFPAVRSSWDHPRICGEKRYRSLLPRRRVGSPPHMRGKGSDGRGARDVEGITPAYAGKSHSRDYRYRCRWDHPRVCGEKAFIFLLSLVDVGSPPRMRGKARLPENTASYSRITPAYAGKSGAVARVPVCSTDHPRVCGEKM